MNNFDEQKNSVVLSVKCAKSFSQRLKGLLGTKEFPEIDGIYFSGVSCIHTFFMQYPIDVLFLTKENTVCKVVKSVGPFRIIWGTLSAFSVIEMQSGAAEDVKIKAGDTIHIKEGKDG